MNNALQLLQVVAVLMTVTGCASSPNSPGSARSSTDGKPRFARLGTNKVHYVTAGQGGPTCVLVHCWAGNLGFWREQVPAVADRARLVLIDLPGHGQSDQPHVPYTLDFFADAVLAVMRDAGVEKATLVGHSMGVAVICRVYAQAPEKVAALVAVDGLLRRPAMTPAQAAEFTAPFSAPDYREHTRRFVGSMFPNPATAALRDRVLADILATPQHVMRGAMDGLFRPDQPDWDPKKVSVPVLVLNAPHPMWTDEYKSYVRSLSPKTDYRTIEGVGHWLMLEKPAEFNAALLQMLAEFGLVKP